MPYPVPAITGIRPRVCSTPARTSRAYSVGERDQNSPAPPHTNMAVGAKEICHSTCSRNRGRSISSSGVKGVTGNASRSVQAL
jgi:hypothetical protein